MTPRRWAGWGAAVVARSGFVGRKAHVARLRKLCGPAVERDIGKALFAGGELIAVEAQIGITTGAVSGAGHVAGPVGGYPNQDTGVLAGNIETNQIEQLIVEVSSNAPYSTALHDGDSSRGGRPFMKLARDARRGDVAQLVYKALNASVRKSRSPD